MTRDKVLQTLITDHFSQYSPARLGVALSGGSDSLALLVLLHDWSRNNGPELHAITVDHGLRPESAAEAAQVTKICTAMDIPHQIVTWAGWNGQGNLPDQARRARYSLMAEWAGAQGIGHIAVGHTANDLAETFLMRLGREAGVDGLSAMVSAWQLQGTTFHRPLLQASREELRDILRHRRLKWLDDPSNEDQAYARVRARTALLALQPLGISTEGLAAVAQKMSDVRQTLYHYVLLAARQLVTLQAGDILINHAGLIALPPEISRRLMQAALKWVSGAEYGPRGRAMAGLMQAIAADRVMTLSGCLICHDGDQLRIAREYKAVAELQCDIAGQWDGLWDGLWDVLWDGRWRVSGPDNENVRVAALGAQGLKLCPKRRETGLPAASLMASPALWRGSELLSAPLAGLENGCKAELIHDLDHFFTTILSVEDVSLSH